MNMVERVARAVYEVSPFRDTAGEYDEQSEIYRRMCRLFARAAIEEMREPTPGMIAEGWSEISKAKEAQGIARLGPGPGMSEAYRAMIDAALSE